VIFEKFLKFSERHCGRSGPLWLRPN